MKIEKNVYSDFQKREREGRLSKEFLFELMPTWKSGRNASNNLEFYI